MRKSIYGAHRLEEDLILLFLIIDRFFLSFFFSHFLLQIFFKCILHNFYAFFFVFNLILSQKDRSHYFILNLLLANKIFDTGAAWYSYSNHWNALEISKGYFIYTFSLPEKRSIENTMYGNENNPTLSQIVAKYIKVSPYSLAEKKCSTSANACVMHPSWRHNLSNMRHAHVMCSSSLSRPLHLAAGLDLSNSRIIFNLSWDKDRT